MESRTSTKSEVNVKDCFLILHESIILWILIRSASHVFMEKKKINSFWLERKKTKKTKKKKNNLVFCIFYNFSSFISYRHRCLGSGERSNTNWPRA